MRVAANRINIAAGDRRRDAARDPDRRRRIAFYQGLLGEVDDPAGSGRRVDRQILAFDPGPGIAGRTQRQPGHGQERRRAGPRAEHHDRGLGGQHHDGAGDSSRPPAARSPRSPTSAAPSRRATTSRRRRRRGRPALRAGHGAAPGGVQPGRRPHRRRHRPRIPVTYIGHSYGGSILGTAEALGLTADRTLYVAAAGAGVGVDDPSDWHNRNPDVLRFSMTAPGDLIEAGAGHPGGPHGADPDEMPGVIHLATGDYDDGRPWPGRGPTPTSSMPLGLLAEHPGGHHR